MPFLALLQFDINIVVVIVVVGVVNFVVVFVIVLFIVVVIVVVVLVVDVVIVVIVYLDQSPSRDAAPIPRSRCDPVTHLADSCRGPPLETRPLVAPWLFLESQKAKAL